MKKQFPFIRLIYDYQKVVNISYIENSLGGDLSDLNGVDLELIFKILLVQTCLVTPKPNDQTMMASASVLVPNNCSMA